MKNIVSIYVLSLLYNLSCQHAVLRLGCVVICEAAPHLYQLTMNADL